MISFVRKRFFVLFIFLAITTLFIVGATTLRKTTETQKISVPPAGEITINGEVVCLPHKQNGGPQTLECAYGLKDLEGRYYGLKDPTPDYAVISKIPFGRMVEIVGTFTPDSNSIYQSIGVIEIKSYTLK